MGLERLREPYVRHLEGPLWESGCKAEIGSPGLCNVTARGRRVVIVRAFVKKTQKTPRREIDLALTRAREVPR
jgi:phage-related protein